MVVVVIVLVLGLVMVMAMDTIVVIVVVVVVTQEPYNRGILIIIDILLIMPQLILMNMEVQFMVKKHG